MPTNMPAWELSPREPHLYDYLLILRKHQWLILSFMLSVVTIVAIATFRMQPVYVATARIEIDRENSNILPFQSADSYDVMMDSDNYIETQAKILTSESLALMTIRDNGLSAEAGVFRSRRNIGSDGHRDPCEPEEAAGTWGVSGKSKRETSAEQPLDGCQLRINGPATGGANRKRAPGSVCEAKFPKPVRLDETSNGMATRFNWPT